MTFIQRLLSILVIGLSSLLVACGPGEGTGTGTADTAPVITTQPASGASNGDTPVALRVVATGGGLAYQWFRDDATIAGATQSTYSATGSGVYYVTVTNTLGKVSSDRATVTISVDPVILFQPQAATVTLSNSARFAVVASGSGLSYQWFRDGVAVNSATGSVLQASAPGTYHVVVSSTRTGARAVTSAKVALTVSTVAVAARITTQPVAVNVTAGSVGVLSVTATGTDLVYKWYRNGVLLASNLGGALVIDSAIATDAGPYYVVVSNSLGFVSSQTVAVTVSLAGSGSNTGVVVAAANTFLNTLTQGQKTFAASAQSATTVLFGDNLANARTWTSTAGDRHGLRLNSDTLSATQLAAADALINSALSAAGATLMSEIRLSDDALFGLGDRTGVGSGFYSIAFIGQPSATAPWTLQLSGHQLTYNISYNASQVSATPMFIGAEPPNWTFSSGGVYTVNNTAASIGTPHAPMEAQRSAVSALAQALQGDAVVAAAAKLASTPADLLMGPGAVSDSNYKTIAYPSGTSGRGVLLASLNDAQKAAVSAVIQAWVKTQATDVAESLLASYLGDAALAATYVAYGPGSGGTADFGEYPNANALPGSAANSYLRIDGPRVWIEFQVRSDGTAAGRVFYRSVWRDKLADYGGRY
ncbi:MAG: Immunoglobulin protein [Rhodoferax sp.]|nr:Immunoglobulin protein [Rhodoferax sp.]